MLIEMREWIGPALAPPDLMLEAQPPAQPHCRVARADVWTDDAYVTAHTSREPAIPRQGTRLFGEDFHG